MNDFPQSEIVVAPTLDNTPFVADGVEMDYLTVAPTVIGKDSDGYDATMQWRPELQSAFFGSKFCDNCDTGVTYENQTQLIPNGFTSYAAIQSSYPGLGLAGDMYSKWVASFNKITDNSFSCPNYDVSEMPARFCKVDMSCTAAASMYNLTNYGFSLNLTTDNTLTTSYGNASLGLEALMVNNGTDASPECFLLVGSIGDQNAQGDATIVLGLQWLYNYFVVLSFNS